MMMMMMVMMMVTMVMMMMMMMMKVMIMMIMMVVMTTTKVTSAVPVAEIGKPPDVTESHGKAETGEEELDGAVPVAAVEAGRVLGAAVADTEELLAEERVILSQAALVLHNIHADWEESSKNSIHFWYLSMNDEELKPLSITRQIRLVEV